MRDGHYSNRDIVRPNPRLVPQDFVRIDSHPMNVGLTRQHEKELEFRDGHHPHRSIVHPDPRLMPRDFVRNYSHPMNAGFTRQHVMQGKLFNDPRITIEYSNSEYPFQSAQTIGHNRPMLTSNVSGCLPLYGPDIPARPLSMQGTFRPVQLRDTSPHSVMGDPNWKQAHPAPSGISWPPESIQRQYVDAPEITPSQFAQARKLLTPELVDNLRKLPSSSVEGTAGASAGTAAAASDVLGHCGLHQTSM